MAFATILFRSSVFLLLLFQLFAAAAASAAMGSYSRVKSLPGFSGPLPFELETGYVGVGDWDEAQIFHYFIKSHGNPQTDPLILWLTGGPGCSALSGLAFEIVGTGFSYNRTSSTLKAGDFSQIRQCLQFLRKWLVDHPKFITNPFYIGGDSYSGMIVPIVAQEILEGNKPVFPSINFQGYILGNPYTIRGTNDNFAIPFAHRMTLISDELFESLKTSCKGKYVNIKPSNVECLRHYETYQECVSKVEQACILVPKCILQSPKRPNVPGRRSLYNTPNWLLDSTSKDQLLDLSSPLFDTRCPEIKYVLSYHWANNDQVRKALHIREGSIGEWIRCRSTENYTFEIESVLPYHMNLSSKGHRSLVYSGDHDMMVSHLDTQAWIKALNYSIVDDWRPWFILGQVAGYTRSYANKMTFATIKGGGHTAEYTRKECHIMFSRWISRESL